MSKRLFFIILFCLGCSGTILAQEVVSLTLNDCLERAVTSSKQLALKRLESEKRDLQYTAERRYFVPEISGYARFYQYLDDRPVYVFPQNINENLSGPVQLGAPLNFYSGITVNQHILDARMFGSKSLRGRMDELSTLQREIDEEEIRYEVIKSFYQAQLLDESRELIIFNTERLDKLEDATRSSVDNGAALGSALEELALRKEEIALSAQELDNQYNQVLGYLRFLCDIPSDTEIRLLASSVENTLEIASGDSTRNKTFELLELQKSLSAESQNQLNASTYPTLDFFAAFQWLQQEGYGDLFTTDGTWFNQHMIGLQLNVPILQSNSRKVKAQESQINQQIISAQQDLIQEKARMEQAKARDDLRLAEANVGVAERKVRLYANQFEKSVVRYEQQFSSLQELLEAESKFRSAKIELQRKKIAYFLAILDLNRAYGALDSFRE